MMLLQSAIENEPFDEDEPVKIAHILTLSRLAIIPLILLFYLHFEWLGISAKLVGPLLLGLLAISEISDIGDGYVARKFNQVTDLGKLLDPLADSISRLAMFFMLTQGTISIPLEWPLLLLSRELIVGGVRTTCAMRGLVLAARLSGKIKAIIQGVSLFLIFFGLTIYQLGHLDLELLRLASTFLVACNALYSLISGLDYCRANWSYVRLLL